MIITTALQVAQSVQQQQAAERAEQQAAQQSERQAEVLRQTAAQERALAEHNAEQVRLQRDREKVQERREQDRLMARSRVGGASTEALLAEADSYSLASGHKDWLTGQQSRDILDTGARRAASYAGQASAYGSRVRSSGGSSLSLLQGGIGAMSNLAGVFSGQNSGLGQ